MSSRLTLENFIFYRASCLREEIVVSGGRWYCYSADPYLQVAVYLYNRFFAALFPEGNGLFVWEVPGGIKNGWILPPPDVKIKNKFDKMRKLC